MNHKHYFIFKAFKVAGRQISPTKTFDSISVIVTSKFNNKKLGNPQKQWKDTRELGLFNNHLRQEEENHFSWQEIKCIHLHFNILHIVLYTVPYFDGEL